MHLVRHGEVENPDHLCYASLPGFHLSDLGVRQAREAARYLGSQPVVAVWSSPLDRALETGAAFAARFGLPVHVDDRLTEWKMADGWAGLGWEALPEERPGQLEAYLAHPHDMAFAQETLAQLADRMTGVITDLSNRYGVGDLVVVSHQDPVQAARLSLTGRSIAGLHQNKPQHGTVVTLRPGTPWAEETSWTPENQGLQVAATSSPESGEQLPVGVEGELG